ncbi:hypothetical protein Bca101_023666 [Brassica carinata]
MTHVDPKSERNASPSTALSNLKSDATEENPPQREEGEEAEEEEEKKRSWNLRPRKACVGGATEVKNQKPGGVMDPPKSNRRVEVKNENHRLWLALSRDEIEEDVFSMSGNKPSRRPRKRAKTLQKHLDVMFPGLCLVGMNADCFRVSTSPAKVGALVTSHARLISRLGSTYPFSNYIDP